MDKLKKKAEEIIKKWKSEMEQQGITDPYRFYRININSMFKDMEEFWDLFFELGINEKL